MEKKIFEMDFRGRKLVVEHGEELGANGIISVRMASDSISQTMQEVLTYGTAVVIEKIEDK